MTWNFRGRDFLTCMIVCEKRFMTHDYTTDKCERFAAECLETLKLTFDSKSRVELMETAKQWLRLAQSGEQRRND
jgi:hypothetical protein